MNQTIVTRGKMIERLAKYIISPMSLKVLQRVDLVAVSVPNYLQTILPHRISLREKPKR